MAVVYINGEFYDKREDAKISVWDHGFLYGDGVFEGIRVYEGRVYKCKEHLQRLYDSAKTIALKMPYPIEKMEELMLETIRRTGEKNCYIRLVVSRGIGDLGLDPGKCKEPTVVIICDTIQLFPEELYDVGVKVIIAATRKNFPESLNPNVKSLNYLSNILAKVEAVQAGVPEAIQINIHGYITEGTADNIFVVKNGAIRTPPSSAGILVGITRNAIIDCAKDLNINITEENMTSHDLYTADEIFLSGTAAEMIPVVEVAGRTIGNGKPGPVYKKLLAELRSHTRREGTEVYK
ncbi:MAG: branched-chain-amino-acid transaminase [Vulcanimicrobiota bacterium]